MMPTLPAAVNGFLFELVAEDGACSGDQGTVVGNKFAADPTIVAVTGGTCSGETFGLKPILQKARIPFVSPSATNPAVTSEDCDVCNRVALSDGLQGEVDADFVYNKLGFRKVAVMHDSSDYGKGWPKSFAMLSKSWAAKWSRSRGRKSATPIFARR
ncbi:MAG: hypothetical protein KatS3mg052_1475 [Candidatus Roseilinea sp.]|nr:MAG: hypothetical protein KatS3mg052_1475 [Candidatus Roseilinea sp.]